MEVSGNYAVSGGNASAEKVAVCADQSELPPSDGLPVGPLVLRCFITFVHILVLTLNNL
jgi:hypothetical protein